ncbi:MAG: hypothetical protein EOP51_20350, partial [Sphingobacteriales bacterium]
MKKICLPIWAVLLLWVNFSHAQQNPAKKTSSVSSILQARNLVRPGNPSPTASSNNLGPKGFIKDRCGYEMQYNKAVAAGYNKAAFEAVIDQKVKEIQAARANGTARFANYVIPVVFHIIHDGTAEGVGANLSAAQVYQQIDQLNKDFGNQSGSPFPQAADAGITFCPVTVDETGNVLAQPGINRINRITRGWTDPTTFGSTNAQVNAMINYIDATIKPNSYWDPTRFVNVWSYNFSNSGLLGYATFPTAGLPGLPAGETATTAGCVFLSGSLGSVASPGTAGDYALGRTVGHEIGHFLGLYHIWGDEDDCSGTDECADTPPCSSDYYSGYPTCTVPVECSGQPRMIQNYMDYSDDGCMNTYTQNQVDRMQAVMLVAPRRPGNNTLCSPPVANQLNFITTSVTVSETGSTGSGCPIYTDRLITVKPAVAANANATVNFSFTGTATQNIDYEVLGSSSLTYVNGESASKSITIRIFDDQAAETSETITATYSITGTGLVAGASTSNTITITDNDVIAGINNTAASTILFTENFGTTANAGNLPAGWVKGSFLDPAGSNVWTVNGVYGAATGFTTAANGRVMHITNGSTAQQTAETAANQYLAGSESDAISVSPAIATTGYSNIKLTFDYACNGEFWDGDWVDLGILRYSTSTQTTGLIPVTGGIADTLTFFSNTIGKTSVTVNLPAAVANQPNLWIGFEWINDVSARNPPPFTIDNIVVTGESLGVETVLGQVSNKPIANGQAIQYVSNTNNIITTLANPNQNIGCITASVKEAGNSITALNTSAGSFFRSNKVIQLTPATTNSSATYQATFYFTTAELAIWGPDVPNLKIMKVADGVALNTTLTAANAQVFTPIVDDQRSTKGYASYTANFTGGFSQFMLVSPATALPVTTLSFEARPAGKNILLNWATSMEINNKGFVVERSTNGTSFTKIGWVDGAVNSDQRRNYSYADNFVQPNTVYHYRLRQTDVDARENISEIKNARVTDRSDVLISISPNPAKNQLKVFAAGTAGLSNINLIDAKGQLVQSWKQVNCSATPQTLDISKITPGIYM